MEWVWILVVIEYVILSLVFGRSLFKALREKAGKPLRRFMQKSRDVKAKSLQSQAGIDHIDKAAINALYSHLKVNVGYSDDKYSKIKKLIKSVNASLAKSGFKKINSYVVINTLANMLSIKNHLSWNTNIKDAPSLEQVAYLISENISASRIIVLYAEGLTVEQILESRDISQAHAVALYS